MATELKDALLSPFAFETRYFTQMRASKPYAKRMVHIGDSTLEDTQ